MAIKAGPLRRDISDIINDQPIYVYRYILISGDGVDTGNSWQPIGSWRGRMDPMGRAVWYTQRGVVGEFGQRVYTLLLPYTADNSTVIDTNQLIELRTPSGTSLGQFIVDWVDRYYDDAGNMWKIECTVEGYQG